MSGPPGQHIGGGLYELVWAVSNCWLGFTEQVPRFDIPRDGTLFDVQGRKHPVYGTYGEYSDAIHLRSTGHLWPLQPMLDLVQPLMEAHKNKAPLPDEPAAMALCPHPGRGCR